jgi:hypothetical protein
MVHPLMQRLVQCASVRFVVFDHSIVCIHIDIGSCGISVGFIGVVGLLQGCASECP